ncbi:hypothetical protein Q5752_002858 [Cryptotrichosporon argae]
MLSAATRRGLALTCPAGPVRRLISTQPVSSAPVRLKPGHWALAAALLVAPAYAYLTRTRLDSRPDVVHSDVPDRVHGATKKREGKTVSVREVLDKREGDEVWVVIDGEVYNMTEFLDDHPGGREIILSNRSRDVSPIFAPRHPADQLEAANLPPNVAHLGRLDVGGATDADRAALRVKTVKSDEDEAGRIRAERDKMDQRGLGVVVNMRDFEKYAEPLLSKVAWAYYASAGDDEITKVENGRAYQRVYFRPRILRKVAEADASTTLMGQPSAIPVFVAPAAMAKLGHPLGEVNLTVGAGKSGIIQAISSNASCSIDEMIAARAPGQPLFYQLYVNRDRAKTGALVRKLDATGFAAIMLTADAPVGGKRERDLRLKGEFEGPAGGVSEKSTETKGVSQAMFAGVDPNLNWDDIKWLRTLTDIPIIVKGVQTVEDALLAHQNGADGIVISNHGGRQLDTTRPCLDVLLEIRRHAPQLLRPAFRGPTGLSPAALQDPARLTPPDANDDDVRQSKPFEIYIDGGISRGTDVVKALCLGANGVGVGRGFLFAQSVAGAAGVEHAVGILESEILLTLRLLGANTIADLRPSMVEVRE